jgi:hypothetical protein
MVWYELANPNPNQHYSCGSGRTNRWGYEQHQRQHSIELSQDSSYDADEKQDATHLVLANMPPFMIFEKTSLHVGNKKQDDEMPLHYGMHPRINKCHQSVVVCQQCLVES